MIRKSKSGLELKTTTRLVHSWLVVLQRLARSSRRCNPQSRDGFFMGIALEIDD
jgi:hypothetical protein